MYQTLLTRRYLTSKVMPLLASVAVMLCVTTELIVWSVMGGFLEMLVSSGRALIGDVAISWPNTGLAHYDDLVKRLEADPEGLIVAAAPTIEGFGMVTFPWGGSPKSVVIKGVDGPSYNRVTGFHGSLWWKPLDQPLPKDKDREDPRIQPENQASLGAWNRRGEALTMDTTASAPAKGDPKLPAPGPAAVVGIEVGRNNDRQPGGWVQPYIFFPGKEIKLMVPAMDRQGRWVQPVIRTVPVVNEFRTGLYEIDSNTILVRLDLLQDMLSMNEADKVEDDRSGGLKPVIDPATGQESFAKPRVIGKDPARVTSILVRGRDDVPLSLLRERCESIYSEFSNAHPEVPSAAAMSRNISTWEDRNSTLIGAVKKETALVMFIFGVVSLTSVFLVLAIFWAMISEKTRDIGTLRAMGASGPGVAGIWVAYGLAIGIVGAIFGGIAAYIIVRNINPIHEWLGSALGIYVWDPRVYYFTEIPSKVEPWKIVAVTLSGVLASVLGALIPAWKAARMDPVKALRFE